MLDPGQALSHYKLIEKIGEGGMGVVWSAEDTVLRRTVALKLLPPGFADDPDRLARFQREARFLASLNHANIAAIHGFEEADGERFLVLEYVPGTSLAVRLRRGALPVEDALRVCAEIARALEAAHEKGVIHRDLKPGNVQLMPDGHVKVLDFGLAKAFGPPPEALDRTRQATVTLATDEHTVFGTTPYMSPEQASAMPLDKRTDIWSFGCILYEALSGHRAFPGDTVSSTIAAIHGREPDWERLVAETPRTIHRLLRRCLEKDRDRRLHDIADARIEIEDAMLGREREEAAEVGLRPQIAQQRLRRETLVAALVGLMAGMIVGVGIAVALATLPLRGAGPASEPRSIQAEILPVEGTEFLMSGEASGTASISPDGRYVTFLARDDNGRQLLWLRPLDSREARPIPGTENARFPFWSPDSRSIAFFGAQSLMQVDVQGGLPLEIAETGANPRGGSWSQHDLILFSPGSLDSIHAVPATGGTPSQVTTLDIQRGETTQRWPWFLPDGRHFLYTAGTHTLNTRSEMNGIYVGDLEDPDHPKPLLQVRSNAEYANGHLLYIRDGVLVAQPFDPDKLELHGNPIPVARGIQFHTGLFRGVFSVADDGTLLYRIAEESNETALVRVDASGSVIEQLRPAAWYGGGRLSRDGKRLAITITDAKVGYGDIWILDLERDVSTRFTFDPADDLAPLWSPDGSRIQFTRMYERAYALYEKAASGEGSESLVAATDLHLIPSDWSPDGQQVVVVAYDPAAFLDADLLLLDVDSGEITPWLATPFNETGGTFSPDGRWVAYCSNESGRIELYVTPFPGPGGKWQISSEGVVPTTVFWGAEGLELYYGTEDGSKNVAVLTAHGSTLDIGSPRLLFKDASIASWMLEPRRDTFLALRAEGRGLDAPITIVTHWTVPLKLGARPDIGED